MKRGVRKPSLRKQADWGVFFAAFLLDSLSITELARKLGLSTGPVERQMHTAYRLGYLTREQRGNHFVYTIKRL
jgi:DNA-binding IclR family transcriptional regulator